METLSKKELSRYNRHIILPEVGMEGQEKLKKARVLVIGAGGLGSPVLQYLTAVGIGTIGVLDFDTVEESNLQRQVLYGQDDIAKLKVERAVAKLKNQNDLVYFEVFNVRLSADNALKILSDFDIIVDGTDNFPTRYLIGDACTILQKPLVFGSIFKFEGQVSVFNYDKTGKRGPTYRCLFPEPPANNEVPNCAEIGVLGVLPGIIGTLQANEVIKIILGIGEVLSGKLLVLDALTLKQTIFSFEADEENSHIVSFQDYESFCNPNKSDSGLLIKNNEISVLELKSELDSGTEIFLLDVREPFERDICNLGGFFIPMNQIPREVEKIPRDHSVVVYCHHGMRSARVVHFLKQECGFSRVYNLQGGIHAWATEIDRELPVY